MSSVNAAGGNNANQVQQQALQTQQTQQNTPVHQPPQPTAAPAAQPQAPELIDGQLIEDGFNDVGNLVGNQFDRNADNVRTATDILTTAAPGGHEILGQNEVKFNRGPRANGHAQGLNEKGDQMRAPTPGGLRDRFVSGGINNVQDVQLFGGQVEGQYQTEGAWGGFEAQGEAFAGAEALGYTLDRRRDHELGAGGMVQVGVGATGSAKYTTPQLDLGVARVGGEVGVKGDAFAGAYAGADGAARFNTDEVVLRAGGEAFAGAMVTASGNAGVTVNDRTLFNVYGSAQGWAGAGAAGEFTFRFDDGKLQVGAGLGAALGLGGKLKGGVEVDFRAIGAAGADLAAQGLEAAGQFARDAGAAVGEVAHNVADGVNQAVDTAVQTVQAVGEGVNQAIDAASEVATDVANQVVETAGDVRDAVVDTATDVANSVADTAEAVGDAVNETANAVVDAAGDAVDAVGDAAGAAADAVGDAANAAADKVKDTWNAVTSWF